MNCKHNHNHHNREQDYNFKFGLGISLNVIFIIVELAFGYFANSSALIADAVHNFSDVLGLIISWVGVWLSGFSKKESFTFAFKKATILASFLNAVLLIAGTIFIIIESVGNLFIESSVNSSIIMIVAFIGIIINGLTAMLFIKNAKEDINIRSAFLHMLADALISLGVVISGVIIFYTGFTKIDGIVGIIIAVVVFFGTYGLFKESLKLILLGVPSSIDIKEIERLIMIQEGVVSIHDLHVWGISTTENSLSVHVIINEKFSLKSLEEQLNKKFKINHTTIQVEFEEGCNTNC